MKVFVVAKWTISKTSNDYLINVDKHKNVFKLSFLKIHYNLPHAEIHPKEYFVSKFEYLWHEVSTPHPPTLANITMTNASELKIKPRFCNVPFPIFLQLFYKLLRIIEILSNTLMLNFTLESLALSVVNLSHDS